MGDSFKLGNFTYRITHVETMQRVGHQLAREEASEGATYVVVRYTEQNDGQETHTGLGSPIKFVDSTGRTYDPARRAQTVLAISERVELVPQLQPGIAHVSLTVFEVPLKSAQGEATLLLRERGLLGRGEARVSVTFPSAG